VSQGFFEMLDGGDDDSVDLVGGDGASFDRRAARHCEHADEAEKTDP